MFKMEDLLWFCLDRKQSQLKIKEMLDSLKYVRLHKSDM